MTPPTASGRPTSTVSGRPAPAASGPRPGRRALFLALAAGSLAPGVTPGLALAVGAGLALTVGNPFPARSARAAKGLLKASVVGLGFGLSLPTVLEVGAAGVGVTAAGIAFALVVGLGLGRLLGVDRATGALISGGTAICGGSAIAALGPVIGAGAPAMAVSLATVFVLNGVALYLFPLVGHALDLSQHQFAVWAAVAIHDTSSVVGAAATYGPQALAEATVLKLTRALWIVPLVLAASAWRRRQGGGEARVAVPWFIGLFVLASAVVAVAPAGAPVYDGIVLLARRGLVLTLFLIGAGLSRTTLRAVGARPMVQGVLLWAAVAVGSLVLIRTWA